MEFRQQIPFTLKSFVFDTTDGFNEIWQAYSSSSVEAYKEWVDDNVEWCSARLQGQATPYRTELKETR